MLNFSRPISADLISHISFACMQAGFDCGPVVGVMSTLLSVAFQEVGYKYVRMCRVTFLYDYDNVAMLCVLFRVKMAKEHLFVKIGKVKKAACREPIRAEGIISINL